MKYEIGDSNQGGYRAFIFTMVVTLVFFIYIAFLHPGVELNELDEVKAKASQSESVEEAEPVTAEE